MTLDFSFVEEEVQSATETGPEPVKTTYELTPPEKILPLIKKRFEHYHEEIDKLEEKANALDVVSDEAAKTATEMLVQIKGVVGQVEDKRKEAIGPADKYVRSVNAFVKPFRDRLNDVAEIPRNKLGIYQYNKELKRREEERKAKEALAEKQRQLDEEAKKKNLEPVKLPEVTVPKKPQPVRTDSGTSSVRMVWDYKVVDISQVPRDYLILNERGVKAAIKGGIRNIPGLEIFEKPSVATRRF